MARGATGSWRRGGRMGRWSSLVALSCLAATMAWVPAASAQEQPSPCAPGILERVFVTAHDGVSLSGWVCRPDVQKKVPTILHSSPYIGNCPGFEACDPTPSDPAWWENPLRPTAAPFKDSLMIAPIRFVEAGYAAAFFEVRGTGLSGGCFQFLGPDEQRDQETLVNWLAGRTWSNEKVGMGGASYHAGTAWSAAIRAPKALKTIVVAGTMSDLYTFQHSPQGAQYPRQGSETGGIYASISLLAPTHALLPSGQEPPATQAWLQQLRERACEDVTDSAALGYLKPVVTDGTVDPDGMRDADFWEPRRLIDHYRDVKASVLMAHGFRDVGHQWQEELTFRALRSHAWQIEGQWGHTFPVGGALPAEWGRADHAHCGVSEIWCQIVFDWLDHFLKGTGEPPPSGVDYQDDRTVPWGMMNEVAWAATSTPEQWHHSSSWPPAESQERVLYLSGSSLTPAPEAGDRTFVSTTAAGENAPLAAMFCNDGLDSALDGRYGTAAVYVSDPLPETVHIAGEPFAYLSVSGDIKDNGLVNVQLAQIDPDRVECGNALLDGVRLLSTGEADLRYHSGGYAAKPFEGTEENPTPVRVDLYGGASRIEAGNRIALVASYGDLNLALWGQDGSGASVLRLHAGTEESSQLVLPVTSGTVGSPPAVAYPPRPFSPDLPDEP